MANVVNFLIFSGAGYAIQSPVYDDCRARSHGRANRPGRGGDRTELPECTQDPTGDVCQGIQQLGNVSEDWWYPGYFLSVLPHFLDVNLIDDLCRDQVVF